jgi:hypothetical protein
MAYPGPRGARGEECVSRVAGEAYIADLKAGTT